MWSLLVRNLSAPANPSGLVERDAHSLTRKGGTCLEVLFYLQRYDEILIRAIAIFAGLIVLLYLARILRQIKRLNKSLGNIIGNMQAYFDVILKEENEQEVEVLVSTSETEKKTEKKTKPETVQTQMVKEETEEKLLEQEQKKMEEEKLFNAVLEEYFS